MRGHASQTVERRGSKPADLTLACDSSVRLCSYSVRLCSYPVAGRILLRVPRLFVTEVDQARSEQIGAIGQYLDHDAVAIVPRGNRTFVVPISPAARIIVNAARASCCPQLRRGTVAVGLIVCNGQL